MRTWPVILPGCLLLAAVALSFNIAPAWLALTALGLIFHCDMPIQPAEDVVLLAHLIEVSDGGVRSETRTSDDTGNSHGNAVLDER
jgi:hypothetical protein